MVRNRCRGTATSAIWNTTYRAVRTTLAPILISFSRSEVNAVAFARCDLRGATAYVTGTPCAACFGRLLQVGIRRIVQGARDSACLNHRELRACEAMARALRVNGVKTGAGEAPAR